MKQRLRVKETQDGPSWVFLDGKPFGPFPTLESALSTINYIEDGMTEFPRATPPPEII